MTSAAGALPSGAQKTSWQEPLHRSEPCLAIIGADDAVRVYRRLVYRNSGPGFDFWASPKLRAHALFRSAV